MEKLKLWYSNLKARMAALWAHRTKALGCLIGLAGYIQNDYARSGLHLPPKYEGILLGGAGAIVFFLGLYNTLKIISEPGPPP